MATHAYVQATDGLAKTWMFDSREYKLPAGKRELFPLEVAQQAQSFFAPWSEQGRAESTVEVTPVESDDLVTIERGSLPKFTCSHCNVFETTDAVAFSAHVPECITGGGPKGAEKDGK